MDRDGAKRLVFPVVFAPLREIAAGSNRPAARLFSELKRDSTKKVARRLL